MIRGPDGLTPSPRNHPSKYNSINFELSLRKSPSNAFRKFLSRISEEITRDVLELLEVSQKYLGNFSEVSRRSRGYLRNISETR